MLPSQLRFVLIVAILRTPERSAAYKPWLCCLDFHHSVLLFLVLEPTQSPCSPSVDPTTSQYSSLFFFFFFSEAKPMEFVKPRPTE